MYPHYYLNVSEYRHPRELITLAIYLVLAIVGAFFLVLFNVGIAIGVVVGFTILFLTWYFSIKAAMGNQVKVSPNQFPEIYHIASQAATRLYIPLPDIYIQQNPVMNAYSTGFGNNFNIVLTSAIVDAMSKEELQFVISHEMGHVKSNHAIYSVITGQLMSNNPIVLLFSWAQYLLRYALTYLSRVYEYTADRAGLIGGGNIYPAITAMTKLAVGKEMFDQINLREYLRQIEELKNTKVGFLAEMEIDHPFLVNRIRGLIHFYKSPEYYQIRQKLGEGGTTTLQYSSGGTMELLDRIIQKYHDSEPANPSVPENRMAPMESSISPSASQVPTQPSREASALICPRCNSKNRAGASFCFHCGMKLQ